MSRRNRTRTAALALAGAALVALAGCGDNDDSSHDTTTSVVGSSAPGSNVPSTQALEKAGATAVAAVPGSVLISIESEHGRTWEAQVVTSDGVEHHVDVSADGATVVGTPRIDDENEIDRAKHRERVKAATLDYTAAAAAVLTAVPGGAITELNLDTDNGTTVWEADVIDGAGAKHEVTIDASTGQVLANTSGR